MKQPNQTRRFAFNLCGLSCLSFLLVCCSCALTSASDTATASSSSSLKMLTTQGSRLVDLAGNKVVLKGCNFGNDLIMESWMFGGTLTIDGQPFRDGMQVHRSLVDRFGQEKADSLLNTYRESWIQPRDLDQIKSFGFNVVRLPFDYRQLQSDQPPYTITIDGFRWIDRTLSMAEAAGLYVILDLHGLPGGQSDQDHTGEAGQNKLWSSEVNQRRAIDVWRAIANRYKDRPVVAAYDLINEPYSDHHTDVRSNLKKLTAEIYDAIRGTGDNHVVYFSGGLNTGIGFYGDPHAYKMTNVGFTEHYYPGLFGSSSTLETQARLINQILPAKEAYVDHLAVPYYVGEFNIVMESEESERMMRAYFDRFAEYGWASTMWSYKLIKLEAGSHPDAWYMVTNAQLIANVDVATSSFEQIDSFFAGMATMPLAVNRPLLNMLTTQSPPLIHLASYPAPTTFAPGTPQSNPAGYLSADIGDANPGHTQTLADGSIVVIGGGTDVNGSADSFRFVSTAAKSGTVDARATITSFVDTDQYSKAGVMARWGNADDAMKPDAAMAMINVFPGGTVALIIRPSAGASTNEVQVAGDPALPIELRLQIDGTKISATYRAVGGEWQAVGNAEVDSGGPVRTGLAVCAHTDAVLTSVAARLNQDADAALAAAHPVDLASASILQNSSFEEQGDGTDRAAGWNRWGDWMNRETGWTPVHSGACEIGYHHWQITKAGSSGLWQEVSVEPGKRYKFSMFAQRDPAPGQNEAETVELRMESITADGQVTLNKQNFDVKTLATGHAWSTLSISGTSQSEKMRVLAVINSSANTPRGGAVKLDDASLTALDGARSSNKTAISSAPSTAETIVMAGAIAHRDLTYINRSTGPEKLDLYLPPGTGPFPLVIWIHGGAWKLGSKSSWPHMNFVLRNEFAVANVEYRFSQVAPFPAQLDDCKAALDFLVAHAAEYHLDPTRIAATGESAGGHLATLLGMSRSAFGINGSEPSTEGRIAAVIDLFGPTDLTVLSKFEPTMTQTVEQLLGGSVESHHDLVVAASPLFQVEKADPPFLIFHGTADKIVPIAQSKELADALAAAGVSASFVPVEGAGHAVPAFWTPDNRDMMLRFLSKELPIR